MQKQVLVKPKNSLLVPDVDRRDALPAEGRKVFWSVYWARRLRDGDIEVVEQQTQPKKKEK